MLKGSADDYDSFSLVINIVGLVRFLRRQVYACNLLFLWGPVGSYGLFYVFIIIEYEARCQIINYLYLFVMRSL